MLAGSVDELTELVRGHAPAEGRIASALPGLWMFRFDRPRPICQNRTTSMLLNVALQGQKRMRIGDVDLLYDRLHYLVIRGETGYAGAPIKASPRSPYLALGLVLAPELVMSTLLELSDGTAPMARASAPLSAFQAPLDAPLVDCLCRLLRTLEDPLDRRVLAPLITREIVFRLLRSEAAAVLRQDLGPRGDQDRIKTAMAHIADNAHRKLTVAGVAKRVAMSPSHFAHRFREVTSMSPMRYQKHVRLSRARELLLADGLRSGQVAQRVGYLSEAQFARDFKRQFGLSPSAYAGTFKTRASALVNPASSEHTAGARGAFAGSSKNSAGPALGQLHAAG